MIHTANDLCLSTHPQEFTWTVDGYPVNLLDALIAIRLWKGSTVAYSASTDDGCVTIGEEPGEFSVRLTENGVRLARGCDIYDVVAWLPEHGMTRVIKGNIQHSPGFLESAIHQQGE